MKIKKNGMTKIVDKELWDYYASKGWTTEEDGEIRAVLKPAKKDTAKTPAVESIEVTIDEEVVVNDETKGD